MSRTCTAVNRHLTAMGGDGFIIGAVWKKEWNHTKDKIQVRDWDIATIITNLSTLRAWNANGAAIFVKPSLPPLGVVLLDDIDNSVIKRLKDDGLAPACVIETSPGNLQAWIRLIENAEKKALSPALVTRAARLLVEQYGGDPASADWHHFGRLAGFTNTKPKYATANGFPFVLVREHAGKVAIKGRDWLIHAGTSLKEDATKESQATDTDRPENHAHTHNYVPSYARMKAAILARNQHAPWIDNPDKNIIDWWIVQALINQGFSDAAIIEVLSQRPDIYQKHRFDDYSKRTIHKARKRLSQSAHDSEQDSTENESF